MIIDITFYNSEPKQYQQVRKTAIWPNNGRPEMSIFYYDSPSPRVDIRMNEIKTLVITND